MLLFYFNDLFSSLPVYKKSFLDINKLRSILRGCEIRSAYSVEGEAKTKIDILSSLAQALNEVDIQTVHKDTLNSFLYCITRNVKFFRQNQFLFFYFFFSFLIFVYTHPKNFDSK
jgi:hypothetical protein